MTCFCVSSLTNDKLFTLGHWWWVKVRLVGIGSDIRHHIWLICRVFSQEVRFLAAELQCFHNWSCCTWGVAVTCVGWRLLQSEGSHMLPDVHIGTQTPKATLANLSFLQVEHPWWMWPGLDTNSILSCLIKILPRPFQTLKSIIFKRKYWLSRAILWLKHPFKGIVKRQTNNIELKERYLDFLPFLDTFFLKK